MHNFSIISMILSYLFKSGSPAFSSKTKGITTMFMTPKEEEFLFKHLNNNQTVLEYGSGTSTIQISKVVKKLISVEHDKEWYTKILPQLPNNVTYLFHPPDFPYDNWHDGTFTEFANYIMSPLDLGPYDVIIIDGRARVDCCIQSYNHGSNKDTIFFVHDFDYQTKGTGREHYIKMLDYLDIIDNADLLFRFKKK